MKIKILIPVYNDWQSVSELLDNIDLSLANVRHEISVLVVNDASNHDRVDNDKTFENIISIKILNMKKNQGHARCIATGLKYIYEKEDFDYVIPMDGDGEDRPDEIKEFINQIENSSHIDSVTGLPDWHYFRQELINNITTQTTSQPRSCMISFQLEHFKTLEQQHGQQLIDQAMQIISKCLTANCKIHDTIARIDSDHLALLTLATDADHARQIAGKFQNLLCQCTCAIPNGRINLSVTSQATMIKIDESVHGLLSRLNLDIESIQSKAAAASASSP